MSPPSPYARRTLAAEARHVGRKTHREFAARPTVLQPQVSLSASVRAECPRQLQAAFPLTLALRAATISRRGREHRTPRCDESRRPGLPKARRMILPLPKGEGRGEG